MPEVAAEEDDEEYLNDIFYSHSLKPSIQSRECPQAQIKQILMKEMHEKYAQQSAKNAAELLQEEEEERRKVERRKERKRRKRERKKAEKEASKTCHSNENGGNVDRNSSVHNVNGNVKNQERGKKDKNGAHDDEKSDGDDDNEGFLDVNSAFVTKVLKHKLKTNASNSSQPKSNSALNTSKERSASPKPTSNGTKIVPIPEKNIHLGERLAVAGYQCASKENYEQAIELFSRALRNVPNDHRYWGNRSFCYFQIGAYQKALEDADCAIQLAPTSPKGHYRRAEALAGLKDLVAAEKSFEKVLELDPDCQDACDELLNIRMLRITEMGFDKKLAYCALKKYQSLEAAVEALMANEDLNIESDEEETNIYQSDEEINWENIGAEDGYTDNHTYNAYSQQPPSEFHNIEHSQNLLPQESMSFSDIDINDSSDTAKTSKKQAAMDPSNPNRCVSIWVGNIEDCVAEKTLNEEFSRFGEILSIRMLPSSHCAFINFKDSKSPGPAMAAMQGKDLAGKKLLIRYPNKTKEEQHIHQQMLCHQKRWQSALSESDSESAGASGGFSYGTQPTVAVANAKTTTRVKLKGPVNGDECYYWRTTGCAFGENCRNKHIRENRGVDRKPWHK